MRYWQPLQLKAYLEYAQPLLMDVREPWEFQICHIAGSRSIPVQQIPKHLLKLNPKQETVLICHHGILSRRVGFFLESLGFSNIIRLNGGIIGWAREVDSKMPTYYVEVCHQTQQYH